MLVQTSEGQIDVSLREVTADNYIVPQGEENVYHVLQEIVQYEPQTGQRISTPRLQKYGKKSFESFIMHELVQQGYTLTYLSTPKMYAEKVAKAAKEAEEAAKAAKKNKDKK